MKLLISKIVLVLGIAALLPGILPAGELLSADCEIQDAVDHYVGLKLSESGVEPAGLAEDGNLLRRTMLDLLGRIPTLGEVQAYIASADADKRVIAVDQMLALPGFARQQANEFDALLMNGQGSIAGYLMDAFRENRPWDEMFRDVLLGAPGDEQQNGALQFVRSKASDIDKLTNETSVAFFGVNITCAKCHDHPLVPQWTQDHFYGMRSFFSRTFENGGFVGERDYGFDSFKTTDGESRDARLMFLTGAVADEPPTPEPGDEQKRREKKQLEEWKKDKQPPSPPSFSRRAQLVEVALRSSENNYFARAIVNKLWNRLFGYGLVMPVDQMHPENTPSHPELLEWLSRDLVSHGYDLRRLIRGLVLSDTYARTSRWSEGGEPRPARELFAVAVPRPLSPQQYAMLLHVGCSNPDTFAADMSATELESRVDAIENRARGLASLFERPGQDFQISVTEALMLSNSDRIQRELLRDAGDSLVGKLKAMETSAQVQLAAWNIFSRAAEPDEARLLEAYLAARADRPLEACQQLVWALLMSSECRFNH